MITYHEKQKQLTKPIINEQNIAERWYCRRLKKEISAQMDAVPVFNEKTKKWEWICECAIDKTITKNGWIGIPNWTSGQDTDHNLIESKPKEWFILL